MQKIASEAMNVDRFDSIEPISISTEMMSKQEGRLVPMVTGHLSHASSNDKTAVAGSLDGQTQDTKFKTVKAKLSPMDLPADYRLSPYDVLCGRSKSAARNVGNKRFRVTISLFVEEYATLNRTDRSKLNARIVDLIRSCGGHFVKETSSSYVDIGDAEARHKVGHALRDTLALRTGVSQVSNYRMKNKNQHTKKKNKFKIIPSNNSNARSSAIPHRNQVRSFMRQVTERQSSFRLKAGDQLQRLSMSSVDLNDILALPDLTRATSLEFVKDMSESADYLQGINVVSAFAA